MNNAESSKNLELLKKRLGSPVRQGFAEEVGCCMINLLSEFFVRTLFGCFLRPLQGRFTLTEVKNSWGHDVIKHINHDDIHNICIIGKSIFSRGIKKESGSSNYIILFLAAFPLVLLMGLLILPFTILRATIKFILLVPRICLLRAEDYFYRKKQEDMMYDYVAIYVNIRVKGSEYNPMYHNLPKRLFGTGHFIYATLYHLAFVSALASVPLLLHALDKLPNIVPHVPTLYLFIGLIALLAIPLMALNVAQCLRINAISAIEEYMIFQDQVDIFIKTSTPDEWSCRFKDLQNIYKDTQIEFLSTQDDHQKDDFPLTTIHLCKALSDTPVAQLFRNTARRTLVIPILHDGLCHGKNLERNNTSLANNISHGLPIIDMYDATTDIGFVLENIAIAPVAIILKIVTVMSNLFSTGKREILV